MRADFITYKQHQVFLNYPFDEDADDLSLAMHFAVIAAGLLPVCAKDLTAPDRPRIEMLVGAITNCQYSAHDFSRCTGEGTANLARFNMPVEMGMALFHALQNQRRDHRCAFFVAAQHDYRRFASDLAGLDPFQYDTDITVVAQMYEWLRDTVGAAFIPKPTIEVTEKYHTLINRMARLRGSGRNVRPSHHEAQEIMYQICSECEWWDWRASRAGKLAFPSVPLS